MALYRVQSNGKAPTGLQAGDEVVTGGGTYRRSPLVRSRTFF